MEPNIAIASAMTALTSSLLLNDHEAVKEQREKLSGLMGIANINREQDNCYDKFQAEGVPLIELTTLIQLRQIQSRQNLLANYLANGIYTNLSELYEGLNPDIVRMLFLAPFAIHLCSLHEIWNAQEASEILLGMISHKPTKRETLELIHSDNPKDTFEAVYSTMPDWVQAFFNSLEIFFKEGTFKGVHEKVSLCYRESNLDFTVGMLAYFVGKKINCIQTVQLATLLKI